MARIVLSNNKQIVDSFVNHCESVGFKKYTRMAPESPESHIHGAVFKKLCIDNENIIELEGGDFVSAVGTFFYKGIMGEKALKQIHSDFKTHKDICKIRQEMNGQFIMAVCYDGTLYVISDAIGFLYCYYHYDETNGTWVIGSSLYEMVKSSPFKCEVNEITLVQRVYSKCILGGDSLINEYKRLAGENYLKVDLKNNQFQVCDANDVTLKTDERPLDEIVKESSAEYRRLGSIIKNNFKEGDVAICMTGGVDSRTAMASLLANDIKPEMYYGIGNSLLTNTTLGDLEVNKVYAEKFGLNLNLMDWNTPKQIDEAWNESVDKWGELATMYSASPAVYKSFESIKESIVFIGCLGELYRTDTDESILEQRQEEYFTIDQVLRSIYQGKDLHSLLGSDYSTYMEVLSDRIKKVLGSYIENGKVRKTNYIFLRYYIERYSDSIVVNFMNQMRYCMSMFADAKIVKYAFISPEYRDDAKFVIQNLNALYPPILDIPVYSRHQWVTIDKENMMLPYPPAIETRSLREYFLRYTRLGSWVRKVLYPVYMRRNEKRRAANGQIKEGSYMPYMNVAKQLKGIFQTLSFFKRDVSVMSSGYLPNDACLAILLTAMKKLNVGFDK